MKVHCNEGVATHIGLSSPVRRIGSMQLSSGIKCDPPRSAREAAATALVALDAGNLNELGDRIAGHAKMVLDGDFCSVAVEN